MKILKNLLILFSILFFILNSGCAFFRFSDTRTIRIKGSDTMLILASRWAEAYMKINPNVSVYVEGGGSEKGIEALIEGDVDITTASRTIKSNEVRMLAEKYKYIGMEFLVAKDGLSIYLNPDNPVTSLTLEQINAIFQGNITNWNQVGGLNEPIIVLIRPPNSGTHLYFKEHILEGSDYSQFAQIMPTTSSVINAVYENREAIGYGGIAYGDNVYHCKINNVEPSEENVRNDKYPIIRYLYLYTRNTPRGDVKSFIDWTLKQGQQIVRDVGYIPLWEGR